MILSVASIGTDRPVTHHRFKQHALRCTRLFFYGALGKKCLGNKKKRSHISTPAHPQNVDFGGLTTLIVCDIENKIRLIYIMSG
ncbi:MAG: hypothetical protein F6J90_41820 [Moorea sp. SIOASIH]|uniref:hypothetical protein n=1 Tax=Moorena sp. SIOASIH TaxID=2607817 RepID=UPI0013B84F49|nr:hypothetical protein [Moorena sp. SIOASIH]NEO42511.1 hypothetical protein [Moorena sp. SIOASIH]